MDRLRQGIFSSLGEKVIDARVCDLFAGTGSYGLEAISRGASSAAFVEKNRKACMMIKTNAKIVAKSMAEPALNTEILATDALKHNSLEQHSFDLVFADPPYDIIESIHLKLFECLDRLLKPDGLAIFETPGQFEYEPNGWILRKRLGKGRDQPTACIYRRENAE